MKGRLGVTLKDKPAMVVSRVSIGRKKLVYAIQAQRAVKYPWGRSRIVYIGTTKKGMARFAQSAAAKANEVLNLHGVRQFQVRLLTCVPRPNVETWKKLERALLLVFRHKYGEVPKCNTVGKRMRWRDEERYFKVKRLEDLLDSMA